MLDHEKLDVYQLSLRFLAAAHRLSAKLPRGHAPLADQLRRAATSIPLNIAEGVGRSGHFEKARFHTIARGSAMECAAILDVLLILEQISASQCNSGKATIERMVGMLTKLSASAKSRARARFTSTSTGRG